MKTINIKIKIIISINLVVLTCLPTKSQINGKFNYIIEKVYNDDESNVSVNYYDGLGRPNQSISIGASPGQNDIVQHIEYDDAGRESIKYLPYASANEGGDFRNAKIEQAAFYANASPVNIATDDAPWTKIIFEPSPLNRVLKQGAPGINWQPSTDGTNDHSIHFIYGTNNEINIVTKFKVNNANELIREGTYNAGILYRNTIIDENGHETKEFKNHKGQLILKEVFDGENWLQTYYVYDDLSLLRYVITPKAIEYILTGTLYSRYNDIIKNLCYYYEYDSYRRLIIKQLPGADQIYMIYDKRDRIVLTQDGNLREDNQWMYTKYNALNRPVLTGIYYNADSIGQIAMQNLVNSEMSTVFTENYDGSTSYHGYTNQAFPRTNIDEILSVMYYDTYDFDVSDNLQNKCLSINNADYPVSKVNMVVKGQVTGTKTKILGTDDYITNISMYDDKYRLLRSYTENPFLEKSDLVVTKYDFIGTVLKTLQVHQKSNVVTDTIHIRQRFEYDHAMRLIAEYHKVSTNPEVKVVSNEYNELSQLIKKDLHKVGTGNPLQSVDYTYNIRGWLTRINNPTVLQQSGQPKDLFAMELAYENNIFGANHQAQYNGSISAVQWTDNKFNENSAYVYSYDNLNRLTGADYQNYESGNWNTSTNEFDLKTVAYDENGNIESLKRYGANETTAIDDLAYAYINSNQSNQLLTVVDAGEMAEGFKDYNNTEDYEYDKNGNLVIDRNKGIDKIEYNYLNLPMNIIGGVDTITYFYTADGTKIAKVNKDKIIKQYLGNVIYDEDKLDYILISEGMVKVAEENTFMYEYFLKDHLGNTRVTFDESGGVASLTQVNHYYPFGMNISSYNFSSQTDNKYKYNGKELQDDMINGTKLDWYDYGARFFDPALARFHTQDRFAEKYNEYSPYQYATNNPILFIDKNGDEPIDPRTGSPVKLNFYRAAIHDLDYIKSTNNRIVVDRDLLASASPFMPRTRNKPDGLWEGAASNKHQSVWQHTSKGASSALKKIFANNPDPSCDFGSPDDNTWKQAARMGTYTFVNDRYAEGEVFQKNLKSFSISTVEENYITQEVNLTRSSGNGEYNISSVTNFDIEKGEVQSKEVDTWWGGTKTVKYRTLTVTETTTQYENNEATDNQTTKTYTTEERVK